LWQGDHQTVVPNRGSAGILGNFQRELEEFGNRFSLAADGNRQVFVLAGNFITFHSHSHLRTARLHQQRQKDKSDETHWPYFSDRA
jgi:hypothetical protein